MRRRQAALWVVSIAIVVVSTLAVGEVTTRVFGLAAGGDGLAMYAPDPRLPYRLRADYHATGRAPTGEFDHDYRHNLLGFRDAEHSPAKPPGTRRILAVGDSFTYGIGVPYEDTYLRRLERMLNAPPGAPPVEILKWGIPRAFPQVEAQLVEDYGLRFEPDLLIVGVTPNDVGDQHLGTAAVAVTADGYLVTQAGARVLADGGPLARVLYHHSHLARLVLRAWTNLRQPEERIPFSQIYVAEGPYEPAWHEVERTLADLVRLMRGRGIATVLLHIPQLPGWGQPDDYPARRLAALAERTGAHAVDPLPRLRAEDSAEVPFYWSKDGHTTAAGAAVIAEVLFEALVEQRLLE